MISVCFVCLGNICRSPMAELVFSKMVEEEGLSHSFEIFSRGTSDCEEGNPIYPPARATLEKHGVSGAHRAAQLTLRDVINVDYLIVMDSSNLMDVLALTAGRFGEKIYKLMSFANAPRDVADPWYTRDFERAYADICEGCRAFLDYLKEEKKEALAYDGRH